MSLLVAVFPANVVAARGVPEPSAPNTPLVRRTLLQLLLLAVCGLAARGPTAAHHRPGRRTAPA